MTAGTARASTSRVAPGDPPAGPARAGAVELSVVDLIDAVATWVRSPGPAERRRLSAELAGYIDAHGIAGVRVTVAASATEAEAGAGTLRRAPSPQRVDRLARVALRGPDDGGRAGGAPTAELLVDGDAERAAVLSRVLRLGVAQADSRSAADAVREQLAALDEATRGIAGILSVERVLQVIVDSVRRLVHARYAALGVLDDQRQIDPFITSGISRIQRERIGPAPHGRGLLGLIIEEGRPLRVPDITGHPRSIGFPPGHPPMQSLLGVPVSVRGRVLGNLYVTDREDGAPFSDADQWLVELFAAHAGIAMENAKLHEQEQRLAILEERQRIGRDLHDGVIQSIYAVGLMLDDALELAPDDPAEASARIERAIESINLTIRDIRNFIFGLRPEPIDQAGLVEALAAMAEEFRVNTMIDITLEVNGPADFEMPAEDTAQLLQLAREALSNVARHAHAGHAEIHLVADERALELAIVDDGVGFDPAARRGPGHMGLGNMRTRAAELGGELLVESAVGRGTRVAVRVPARGVTSGGSDTPA